MTISRVIPLLLCIALLSCMADSHSTIGNKYNSTYMETRFKSWTKVHNKHYNDKDEWMLRLGIYEANLNFIDFINSQNLSYQLGDNEFADLTNDEFRALYVGRLKFMKPTNGGENSTVSINREDPPEEVDWRKKGSVNAIKHQGQCGSCWAFSTAAAIEGAKHIKTGKLVSLSEQELVDCDTKGQNKGCNGGLMEEAFKFVESNNGISTETDYPYTGKQGPCKKTPAKAVLISGYKTVKANSEDELMAAVAQQPVSAALEAKRSPFQLYKSGIFTGECGTRLDHAINLVGYGAEGEQKFWIMRNSWGTSWGEQGYMRLLRGGKPQGTCGVAMLASYPLAA